MTTKPATQTAPTTCCSTTDDGSMICLVPAAGQAASCNCQATLIQEIPIVPAQKAAQTSPRLPTGAEIRSGLAFLVACITSPCCTPLFIPLLISLAAGSPLALWLSYNVGWVYGGLSLISILSFVLAFRWMNKTKPMKRTNLITFQGEQSHVEA